MKRVMAFLVIAVLLALTSVIPVSAYQELSLDVPLRGTGIITYSRLWPVKRWIDAGFFIAGGQVNREFDVDAPGVPDMEGRTEAWVLPFFGPRISLHGNFVGISLTYGAFWARTDFEVDWPGGPTLEGTTSGWGSAIYAPLLVMEFYNSEKSMSFGLGVGGYLGTSYPTLEATGPGLRVTSNEDPLETITIHFRTLWTDRGSNSRGGGKSSDDF